MPDATVIYFWLSLLIAFETTLFGWTGYKDWRVARRVDALAVARQAGAQAIAGAILILGFGTETWLGWYCINAPDEACGRYVVAVLILERITTAAALAVLWIARARNIKRSARMRLEHDREVLARRLPVLDEEDKVVGTAFVEAAVEKPPLAVKIITKQDDEPLPVTVVGE